jgi:hypothetical protein
MRDGHPALDCAGITSEVLTPRRRDAALEQLRVPRAKFKRVGTEPFVTAKWATLNPISNASMRAT